MNFKQALQQIDLHLRMHQEIEPEKLAEAMMIVAHTAFAPIDFSAVDSLLQSKSEEIHSDVRNWLDSKKYPTQY